MNLTRLLVSTLLACTVAGPVRAAESGRSLVNSLTWSKGPAEVDFRCGATLALPEGFLFLDGPGTQKLLASFGNKTSGREIGFLTPASRTWFVIVEHLDLDHIRDSEWQTLDAGALLRSMQRTDEDANAERERNGWPTVSVHDWAVRPRYDPDTHTMEWAVRAESGGKSVVNHTISLLGRKGAVQFSLIDPAQQSASLQAFRGLVRHCSFQPRERYVDHRAGDPVAKGGLTALVGGVDEPEELTETEPSGTAPFDPESRDPSPWKLAGLAAIVAAVAVGFVCGRMTGRRGRRRYSRMEKTVPRDLPDRRGAVRVPSGVPATPVTPVAGTGVESPMAASASPDPRRIKRYDSYSFYLALTRDLHWTINY